MILSFYEVFFQLPAPPKNPKGSPRGFLPRPLLRAGELQNPRRISKTVVSVLRILSPENSFAKPSPHLYSHHSVLFLWKSSVLRTEAL